MRRFAVVTGLYVVCLAVALALCALLVSLTGGSWSKVFSALLDGSIRSPGAWGLTVTTAAPLLIVATGAILTAKTGLTNIGQEGQLLIGAAVTAYLAVRIGGPGWVALVAALALGAAAGGLWAGLAAGMRYWRRVPEVISTLLLVFVAVQLVSYGLTQKSLLLDRASTITHTNVGETLPADTLLPTWTIFGNDVGASALIAVVGAAAVAVVLARSVVGFRLRLLGMNARTAQRAGVRASTYGGAALVGGGALAGLAGGALLTGGTAGDRLTVGFSGNFGWQGLLVALLARDRPIIAIPMAFVFAALRTGSGFLAATGVERRIADVVQAMLVLALLVPPAVMALRDRRRSVVGARAGSGPVPAPATPTPVGASS